MVKNGMPLSKVEPNNVLRKSFSLGERILGGRTILTISNVVSNEEIGFLVRSSIQSSDRRRRRQKHNGSTDDIGSSNSNGSSSNNEILLEQGVPGKIFVRLLTHATARRENCLEDAMDEEASILVDTILERTMRILDSPDNVCPSLKTTLFCASSINTPSSASASDNPPSSSTSPISIAKLFKSNQLDYSIREPAINVYEKQGQFVMHKDHHALSIVIPLSDPKEDFQGGGTAFWNQSHPVDGMDRPSIVLKPKPGTAMLWGGRVSHKGMPVSHGTRVVIVASFSGPDSPNMKEDVRDRLSAGLGVKSIMSGR